MHDLFGPEPRIDCFLAFMDGYPVGYAIVLETYSSFLALADALPGRSLRARGVSQAARRPGAFDAALEEAKRRGCGRMEWTVLDWNQLAIDFYQKLGGKAYGGVAALPHDTTRHS